MPQSFCVRGMRTLAFVEQCAADTGVVRLFVEGGAASMVVMVHVDDVISVGWKGKVRPGW